MLPNPAWIGSALTDLMTGDDRPQRPDFRQAFYLALAKVLGAAAWVDGAINQAEVNVIKSLLHELSPRLTARELERVQRYLEEPVPDAHWLELQTQLAEFTRRRTRLQFAMDRLGALLTADGPMNQAESALIAQVGALLGWHGGDRGRGGSAVGQERPASRSNAGSGGDAGRPVRPAAGLRLGQLTAASGGREPPALLDRIRAATRAHLAASGSHQSPPHKLYLLAATVAFVRGARIGISGEDAELVGFTAAVTDVTTEVAAAALAAARRHPAAPADLDELAAELRRRAEPTEIGALAQLLNSMADGETALRRLRQLTGTHNPPQSEIMGR